MIMTRNYKGLCRLFLWSFYVRESEFLSLKTQQSLRVDFYGFPEVIIEHLNYCSNF